MADTNQDFKQVIADAILDSDSLERFINGDDTQTVITRLNAQYPTLRKALKELFIEGGIAGRFEKFTDLQASNLADGKYALVADDIADKNGVYIKKGGVWVKTSYNIANATEELVREKVAKLAVLLTNAPELTKKLKTGSTVNYNDDPELFGYRDYFSHIEIGVKDYEYIIVTGTAKKSEWLWVATDQVTSKRLLVTDFAGDGIIKLPKDTWYVVRTSKNKDVIDDSYKVYGVKKGVNLQDLYDMQTYFAENYVKKSIVKSDVQIDRVMNFAVNNDEVNPYVISEGIGNGDRSYFKVNVEGVTYLDISNARIDNNRMVWAFTDDDSTIRSSLSDFYGNGKLYIPKGAKWAYRTYHAYAWMENPDIKVVAVKETPTADDLEFLRDFRAATGSQDIKDIKALASPSVARAQEAIEKSGMGVVKISDFEGADSHEKIEKAIAFIKKRGHGILDLESGTHLRRSAILMPSNCWLYLNNATLKLADGVHDNLIRNDGIVPNSDPYGMALELNENRNIRIFGNGIEHSAIEGPNVPYAAPHPTKGGGSVPWVGDWYGWRTLEINLANVKDYEIHDFSMSKTRCWAITQQHGCENFKIHNIHFDTRVKNGDGIDVLLGCKNGEIYNITGYTHDDTVALSALHNYVTKLPGNVYIYPMMIGSWGDRGFGIDIENIEIHDIEASGGNNGVRLLASGGSKVQQISLSNIYDTQDGFGLSLVLSSSGYGEMASMGDINNITANNIVSKNSKEALKLQHVISDSVFNKIRQLNSNKVIVDNTANTQNLTITNAKYGS